ncbi:MAG: radical SAM protein [Candidatus Omnitrophota bacterium]
MKPALIIADKNHNILDVPGLQPAASKAGILFPLSRKDLIKLPFGSELFVLPERYPVGYDSKTGQLTTLKTNPYSKLREKCFAVAAFVSPGYTATYSTAYVQEKNAKMLPLFSYAPVAFYDGDFYVPAVRVDREKRQDLRLMSIKKIKQNVKKFEKIFAGNRLFKHLTKCALVYNCPAGKNFFLQRYECPLPTSPKCNARCAGCLSFQPDKNCSITQPRITFTPTAEEISQVALFHINDVRNPVVSFGQGCEGEPLMVSDVLLEAIKLIRKDTKKGTINLNTNASKPKIVKQLFAAGLDSIRVSLNSVQEKYYNAYFKPIGYKFEDVIRSIEYTKAAGGFVSINYFTAPGFTDEIAEVKTLLKFLKDNRIDMIQWRNLNYDPAAYARLMKVALRPENMIGIKNLMKEIKKRFSKIKFGYFNPPKEKWISP